MQVKDHQYYDFKMNWKMRFMEGTGKNYLTKGIMGVVFRY